MKKFICILIILLSLNLNICGSQVSVDAESAIVMDIETSKVLYAKNIYNKHYPASITKVLTTLVTLKNTTKEDLSDVITFSKNAVYNLEPGSSNIGIMEGEQLTLEQALYGMLLRSANEVSNGIAEYIGNNSLDDFIKKMNDTAIELGAFNSHFVNPHGLHDENHYTTCYDMALIAKETYKYDIFREIIATPIYTIGLTNKSSEERTLAQQHSMLPDSKNNPKFHYEGCKGGKTGYTDQAQHTLITFAEKNNMKLVCVVLKSKRESKYTDTASLLDYCFENYTKLTIINDCVTLPKIPVFTQNKNKQLGLINLTVQNSYPYITNNTTITTNDIDIKLNVPEYLPTPIYKNQQVGTLDYYYNSSKIGSVAVFSQNNVTDSTKETFANSNTHNKYTLPFAVRLFFTIISLCLVVIIIFLTTKFLKKIF